MTEDEIIALACSLKLGRFIPAMVGRPWGPFYTDNSHCTAELLAFADAMQKDGYAEGRADEREELSKMFREEAASLLEKAKRCNDGRSEWMAVGILAMADALQGIDSSTGKPVSATALEAAVLAFNVERWELDGSNPNPPEGDPRA